jgi:transcriptional regulator with XRE-family HTH domain
MLKLKEIREKKKIKAKDVVKELGISRITLWQWENGKRSPSIESVAKLAKLYKCSINDIVKVDKEK